ncbi:MAG: transglutaminase domain-containing protein [Candidatus Lokiarchaeota archaeon]|nr:transglutaminase domain-containing protein [Candidatus Lokiarchaeota archaeon]
MSEIREKILGPSNVRSQILKVVFLSVILVVAFAFSVALLNIAFGSLRNIPSEKQSNADYEYLEEVDIPFPFDPLALLQLFQDLGLEITPEMIEDLLDMFDGDFDDIPLEDLAALMAALMFSNVEVFSVYDHELTPIDDMEDYLWKYECYDQYRDGVWSAMDSDLDTVDFFTDYTEPQLGYTEIYKIKFSNLSVSAGTNQFTAPTLFSSPLIMQGSVEAQQLDTDSVLVRAQTDGLNGAALRASFDSDVNTDLSYLLRGVSLPTEEDLNGSCVYVSNPSSGYTQLIDTYQQVNGEDLFTYIDRSWMTDFKVVYDDLAANIIQPEDNAFIIANKIRNYLQSNYTLNYSPMPETETDRLNWFCASGEGLYSDFASVFCILARAFDVPARFVDGFNNRAVEQKIDPIEGSGFSVLYRNIYSWAEIFVPTDAQGNGAWQQFDVYYENYEGIPLVPPFLESNYTLDVMCNGHSIYDPFYALVDRTDSITLSANLTLNSVPVPDELITFKNYGSSTALGTATTNSSGIAEITVPVGSSRVAGPNFVIGEYSPNVLGFGYFIVNDTLSITFNIINPSSPTAINVSDVSNSTISVSGYVEDSNSNRVRYTNIEFALYENGTTNRFYAFNPDTTTADNNGAFSADLFVDGNFVDKGDYQVFASAMGTWNYTFPPDTTIYTIPSPYFPSSVTGMSAPQALFIDKEIPLILNFYINDIPSDDASSPIVSRGSTLSLKAQVLDPIGTPVDGVVVEYYEYTNGTLIGSATTGPTGNTTTIVNYLVGKYNATVGPNLLYARVGYQYNYSYYILDDNVSFSSISLTGPFPSLVVNKTQGDYFIVSGYLYDEKSNAPVEYSRVTLRMFKGITNYELTTSVNADGSFSIASYATGMEVGNYSLRLDFNGSYVINSPHPYPYNFNLTLISGYHIFLSELQITEFSPIRLDFWINDIPADDYQNPVITRSKSVNLSVYLSQGLVPISGRVYLYDLTNDTDIGFIDTGSDGFAWLTYNTTSNTLAGPHLIRARYGASLYNYSYFVLNAPITVSFDAGPDPTWVYDNYYTNRTFRIQGSLIDATNGLPITGGIVETILVGGLDSYLTSNGGSQQVDNFFICNQTGLINAYYNITTGTPHQNYTLRLDFYGAFYNYFGIPSFPNVLDLSSFSNFTVSDFGLNQLEVRDYYNLMITLLVNGNPVPYVYPSGSLPAIVNLGNNITFSGTVYHSTPVGTIRIYDYYANPSTPIAATPTDGSGNYYIELNTSSYSLHSGLHLFRVTYVYMGSEFPTYNSTYIIVDETISSFSMTSTESNVIRNVDSFIISGYLQDGGFGLRGLQVQLRLYDGAMVDRSQYLILESGYSLTAITDNSGYYRFEINHLNISCPQGSYTIRVEFYGNIIRSDFPISIGISGAMTGSNSNSISLTVNAGMYFESLLSGFNTDFQPLNPSDWYLFDVLHVWGRLVWDNGTGVSGATLNITVEYRVNNIVFAYDDTFTTDPNGYFNGSIDVDSRFDDVEMISQTIISVNYNPIDDGFTYVIAPDEETYN